MGTLSQNLLRAQVSDEPLAMFRYKTLYYYHADGLGSITDGGTNKMKKFISIGFFLGIFVACLMIGFIFLSAPLQLRGSLSDYLLVLLWPASIGLMSIQPNSSPLIEALVFGGLATANGFTYGLGAALIWPLWRLRKRRKPKGERRGIGLL